MNEVYLTPTEYLAMAGAEPPGGFATLETAARKRIDYLTASRVKEMQVVPMAVKQCMIALMQIDAKAGAIAQAEKPAVTSFSTDGYSESYGNAYSVSSANAEMQNTIKTYLYGEKDDRGIPLLYRGVEHDSF